MIKCYHCKKRIRQGERVIPIGSLIENKRHGDFVSTHHDEYIHLSHLLNP